MSGYGWTQHVDANLFPKGVCRVAIVGDMGVGKTSLIQTALNSSYPVLPQHVLLPTRLPVDITPERIPLEVLDTSSKEENQQALEQTLIDCEVVVVCYAMDKFETLQKVQTHWLPEIKRLTFNKPVIVVGCKSELGGDIQAEVQAAGEHLLKKFPFVESLLECSSKEQLYIKNVFQFALKAVIYPQGPLYDGQLGKLKPLCVKALKRVFMLLDYDRDGSLNDAELNAFQVRCFGAPLAPNDLVEVKNVVKSKVPEGVNKHGLTLFGFLFLQALFIERGRLETTWTVLKKFGYNTNLLISDQVLSKVPENPTLDEVTELTPLALSFLKESFKIFDRDNDGAMNESEIDDLFSTTPENPFNREEWKRVYGTTNDRGCISREGFLAKWAYLALMEPRTALASILYLGYSDNSQLTEEIVGMGAGQKLLRTIPRRPPRKTNKTIDNTNQRSVFLCYLFGVKGSGKAALLEGLLRLEGSRLQSGQMVAVGATQIGGEDKFLALKRISEEETEKCLQDPSKRCDFLGLCDVAAFVFDSSNLANFQTAHEQMIRVAEASNHMLPCLFVATKEDLGMSQEMISMVKGTCSQLALPDPVRVSVMAQGGANAGFKRIIMAAIVPGQYRPLTPALKVQLEYEKNMRNAIYLGGAVVGSLAMGYLLYKILFKSGESDEVRQIPHIQKYRMG